MGEWWEPWKSLGSLSPMEGESIGTSSLPGDFWDVWTKEKDDCMVTCPMMSLPAVPEQGFVLQGFEWWSVVDYSL